MIRAAVLGSPISHSLSPLLHSVAYKHLGVQGIYTPIEVKDGQLKGFLDSCDDSWTGFSLTMPLKEEVLELASQVSDLAKRIRSANTLYKVDNEWAAQTTDVPGFTQALHAHGKDASGHVVIVGAGATARAVAAACDGVSSHITVMARSTTKLEMMSNCVEHSTLDFVSWGDCNYFESADVIVSTTPAGATDSLVDFFPANPTGLFFDVLYKPWPTKALATWVKSGAESIDGLELLIHQGIDQVGLFTGLIFDRKEMSALMRKEALKALK